MTYRVINHDPTTIDQLRRLYAQIQNPDFSNSNWAWNQIGVMRVLLADLLRQIDAQEETQS